MSDRSRQLPRTSDLMKVSSEENVSKKRIKKTTDKMSRNKKPDFYTKKLQKSQNTKTLW